MKIIIAGASGFLGSNLSNYLQDKSNNIEKISLRDNNSTFDRNADVMINLVGKAHDDSGKAVVDDFYYANVELLKILFNKFKESNIRTFIHISSIAAVEEFFSESPLEENNICKPVSWYGKSKREAEEWLLSQSKNILPEKKIIILRPPMIHGKGDKGNLKKLYKFISKGIPYPLSAFDNERSFLSIDNFCYFIDKIITEDSLESSIYNISDDKSLGTKQVVDLICKVDNKKKSSFQIPRFFIEAIAKTGNFLPLPINSIRLKKMTSNLVVSNKKIKKSLNIDKLPLTAEEGLIKTIKSFKE